MARRAYVRHIKAHRSYTIEQAADCVGVSPQTIRRWGKDGLRIMSSTRPHLILGADLRDWIKGANAPKREPMPVGVFRCFGCKRIEAPALGAVDYAPRSESH